ncbi:hypothetical protein [Corynebacterium rouxii]|uniref:Uncharacterized protein n=2 Tax=Corynebacterium rouxii TaxID=2719119 RepID=A0A6I8MFV2_9CORY|nr:hypothetical protein [Corynebacterium rouxii]MDT9407790.1 hypothetical protein [Corynebacterium rouxii]MDT9409972.1 hypothetical protein [Corynebacterium rouxii]VZH84046.1 hypothetical protein FRC0190_00092 [Corynebacterium rouxii]
MTSQIKERFYDFAISNGNPYPRWRNPRSTHLLVTGYFVSLVLALIFELLMFIWIHFIWVFIACMFIAMTCWTILRSTIDLKDMAPEDRLDDYEKAVINKWRQRSLSTALSLLFIGGLAAIIASTSLIAPDSPLSPNLLAIFAGLYMIYTYLFASSLPAVGYALTFNRNPEE